MITEIMKDPTKVADYYGEYFEIYNASGSDVDLAGLDVWDADTNSFTVASSVLIAAGEYAVLSLNSTSGVNGEIPTVDYKYASSTFRLDNNSDEIYLANDSYVIDGVEYDPATFPSTAGAALSLDPDSLDATSNDLSSAWCLATSAYGAGDYGTPGSANDACGMPTSLGDLAEGDLIVTEIMKDPTKVADYYGEYLEVYNASGLDVDLYGLIVTDLGSDSFTITSSVPLAAADVALLVVGSAAVNGGIPVLDYDYPSSTWRLDNSADEVVLSYGGVVFDSVSYTTSFPNTPGVALSLNPDLWDSSSNDSAWSWCEATSTYGLGDYGTPGSANDACPVDADHDGYTADDGDCDDTDATVYPGATDSDDLVDEDCDGLVDEDVVEAYDIVVSEIMYDPYEVSDTYGEWFELYNASSRTIDLVGWEFTGSDGDHFTVSSSTLIEAGDMLVFGVRSDTTINGGVTVDYVYPRGTFKLTNTGDDIIVGLDGATISSVAYDADWSLRTGYARQIDPDYAGTKYSGDGLAWCEAKATYGLGDYGTPGTANRECHIYGSITSGELIITEIMIDPVMVADNYGEYFEVHNLTEYTLDLEGLTIQDGGTDTFTISTPFLLGESEAGLFVINGDSTLNGGISNWDYVYPVTGLRFKNGADSLYIYNGSELVDSVVYPAGTVSHIGSGASFSLNLPCYRDDVDVYTCWCAATSTYGLGDLGTPGSVNGSCP